MFKMTRGSTRLGGLMMLPGGQSFGLIYGSAKDLHQHPWPYGGTLWDHGAASLSD
jgi:hypothetical protein